MFNILFDIAIYKILFTIRLRQIASSVFFVFIMEVSSCLLIYKKSESVKRAYNPQAYIYTSSNHFICFFFFLLVRIIIEHGHGCIRCCEPAARDVIPAEPYFLEISIAQALTKLVDRWLTQTTNR